MSGFERCRCSFSETRFVTCFDCLGSVFCMSSYSKDGRCFLMVSCDGKLRENKSPLAFIETLCGNIAKRNSKPATVFGNFSVCQLLS